MDNILLKKVPTPLGLIVIAAAIIIFLGGSFIYEHVAVANFEKSMLITGILPAIQK